MKKKRNLLLIWAGIFTFVGIAIMVITGVIVVKNRVDLFGFHHNYEQEANDMKGDTIDIANMNINAIELTGNYGKVEFVKGDRFSYQVIGTDDSSNMFTHDVDNDVWKINVKNRSGFYFFGFGSDEHISKLRITVPSTRVLDHVYVKVSAGNVDVERLAAKDIKLEMGAGTLTADEIVAEEHTRLTVSAGQCKVDNIIGKDPSIRCEAGQIRAKGILTGKGNINCSVGEIDLDMVGDSKDYDYKVSCGIGAIKIDGAQVGGLATKNNKNSGAANQFDLDCGIGQINLDFVDKNN